MALYLQPWHGLIEFLCRNASYNLYIKIYFKNEAWTEKESILCLKICTIQFMFLPQPYKIIPLTKLQELDDTLIETLRHSKAETP